MDIIAHTGTCPCIDTLMIKGTFLQLVHRGCQMSSVALQVAFSLKDVGIQQPGNIQSKIVLSVASWEM